jgi:hypothetical protein
MHTFARAFWYASFATGVVPPRSAASGNATRRTAKTHLTVRADTSEGPAACRETITGSLAARVCVCTVSPSDTS